MATPPIRAMEADVFPHMELSLMMKISLPKILALAFCPWQTVNQIQMDARGQKHMRKIRLFVGGVKLIGSPMERAQSLLQLIQEEADKVWELRIPSHQVHVGPSFCEDLALRGIRVDQVEPGRVCCTFKDRSGSMALGAIANIIDIVGNALVYKADCPMKVSTAKLHVGQSKLVALEKLAKQAMVSILLAKKLRHCHG